MTSAEGLCTEEDVLTSEWPAKERKKGEICSKRKAMKALT